MSEILIKVENVNKTYQRGGETLTVLDELNLDVPKQDFLALMGPSGSGKSTLLNLMGGLDTPTSGGIGINGVQLDQMNAKQLSSWRSSNVGFIFQFYNLLPVLTADKNVELPLLLTNLSKSQRKDHVLTAMKAVGIDDRSDHKPSELSGGQQQRIAIARALYKNADVLVFDEATSALDNQTEDSVMQAIEGLGREITVIMIAHRLTTLKKCTKIIKLAEGKVDKIGSYKDIIKKN